jgi:hypothetical protein
MDNSFQAVETQFEVLVVAPEIDFMEIDAAKVPVKERREFLRTYGRLLNSCIERMLLLLIYRVRVFLQEPENRLTGSVGGYCKAVADTLDYTALESQVRCCCFVVQLIESLFNF